MYKAIADQHSEQGWKIRERQVSTKSLDAILADLRLPQIHFLKIDVEGAEREVLEGIDLERYRPWIILAEATRPLSQVATYRAWNKILTGQRYKFVYSDGLNRFYLADEHRPLRKAFATQPNIFDDYITHTEWSAQQDRDQLITELQNKQRKQDALTEKLGLSQEKSEQLSQILAKREKEWVAEKIRGEKKLARLTSAMAEREKEWVAEKIRGEKKFAGLTSALAEQEQELANIEAESIRLFKDLHRANTWGRHALDRIHLLETRLSELHASKSWRVTAPLRHASDRRKKISTAMRTFIGRLTVGLADRMRRVAPKAVHRLHTYRTVRYMFRWLAFRPDTKPAILEIATVAAPSHGSAENGVPAYLGRENIHVSLVREIDSWRLGKRVDE